MRPWRLVLTALLGAGCADKTVNTVVHADAMRGFTPDEAAAVAQGSVIDGCAVRGGELVIEVVDAFVREWPVEPGGEIERKKQPLLLVELHGPGSGTGTSEIVPIVAPEAYAAGESLRYFVGRRVLVRPLRLLEGRVLTMKLAKNNRTGEPLWEPYAQRIGQATVGAASAVGLPSVPAEGLNVAFEIVRRLTPDDRVLEWSTPIGDLTNAMRRDAKQAMRVALKTHRAFGALPSAEMVLFAYVEPEPGCPVAW
jgi:hypothetical protein